MLVLLGLTDAFWLALVCLVLWGLIFAADMPIRQAYLNDMIPSRQRATVLSFNSLMGSSGGVVIQPALGRGGRRLRLRDVFRHRGAHSAARSPVPLSQPAGAVRLGHRRQLDGCHSAAVRPARERRIDGKGRR